MRLPLFNSPKAGLCTCLPKYNLNTYLGRCAHRCIYCYAVKFPSFIGPTRPRFSLLEQIDGMAKNTKHKLPVMMSDCTDPYQPLEAEHSITRRCVEVLAKHGFPLLIVTKSDLVTRDIDVFKQTSTVVSMTVTTSDESIAKRIEPFAPSPEKRLSALHKIVREGIPGVARIDPILPTVNEDEKSFENLVLALADIGVKQITVATMKHVRGFFSTLKRTEPETYKRLSKEYVDGTWAVGYKYLPRQRRWMIIQKLRPIVLKHGLAFASCREGLSQYNTTICDGTAYCRNSFDYHPTVENH
jgi:DNA repair photolyase